jgi:hypothetical protein
MPIDAPTSFGLAASVIPPGATTFSLAFGPYTDALGANAATLTGRLYPVDQVTGRRTKVVHAATGQVILPTDITITVTGGVATTIGPLPHTGQSSMTPFFYHVEWALPANSPFSPGNKTFAVLSGTTVDYDTTALVTPATLNTSDAAVAALFNDPTSATYAKVAGKQDVSTLGASVVADATVRAAFGSPVIDLVKSCGAVGDGKVVADAAVTSGSAVLTSVTGIFSSSDVLKPITVGGAGAAGADLRTTILSRQSATQVTLAATAATTQTATGAIWGTDNGPALQTALDAVATNSGGDVFIPAGKFCVFTAASHADYGDHVRPTLRIAGLGTQSRIYVAVGSGANMLTAANLEAFTVDRVTFVGCPTSNSDASRTLNLAQIPRVILRDCQFYNLATGSLAADPSNTGVIYHDNCDIKLERCAFHGCVGAAGKPNSVVYGTACLGWHAVDSLWFDYGYLDGIYFNKSMTGALTQAWCFFTNFRTGNDANEQSVLRFTNCRMDEYAQFAIQVLGSSGAHAAHLVIDGHQTNVSWASGAAAVYARYVDYVTVNDSRFGYRTATPAASIVDLGNVVKATLSRVVGAVQATQITVDATVTTLELNDCTGVALAGSAGKTEIRTGGGPVSPGTRFGFTWVQPFTTTLLANNMYYAGVTIPAATKLTGVVVSTSSGAGNLIVALYDASGTRLAVSASTAQANSNAQFVPFTSQVSVPAGVYYIAVMPSTSTQNFNQALPLGGSSSSGQGSFAMPTTITPPPVAGVTQMPAHRRRTVQDVGTQDPHPRPGRPRLLHRQRRHRRPRHRTVLRHPARRHRSRAEREQGRGALQPRHQPRRLRRRVAPDDTGSDGLRSPRRASGRTTSPATSTSPASPPRRPRSCPARSSSAPTGCPAWTTPTRPGWCTPRAPSAAGTSTSATATTPPPTCGCSATAGAPRGVTPAVRYSGADFAKLLAEQGDATTFVPITQPHDCPARP